MSAKEPTIIDRMILPGEIFEEDSIIFKTYVPEGVQATAWRWRYRA